MTFLRRLVLWAPLLAAAGCAAPHALEPAAPRVVRVTDARVPDAPRGARYAVTIAPDERVSLAMKAAGYVTALHQVRGDDGRVRALQPGDAVRAGTVLARIRDEEYRERLREAMARAREAEAGEARARLDFARARTLFDGESLTQPELDAARAAHEAAAARVAAAAAQTAMATLALADCTLVAPIDGVVLERPLEAGSLAAVGTVAVVLGDVRTVRAVFGVPDALVRAVTRGARLTMTSEAFPGEAFAGQVTAVAPSADAQSRVFAVELSLQNRSGRLRPGMIGAVELSPQTAPAEGVAVPVGAIVRAPDDSGAFTVFVVESGPAGHVARSRSVTLGPSVGNAVLVTRGLAPGERVVTLGAALLTEGEAVRVMP